LIRIAPDAGLPAYRELDDALGVSDLSQRPCLVGWKHRYDYISILHAGGLSYLANFVPQTLELLASNDYATLFAVRQARQEPR
jgi:hypothetical protein